MPQWLSMHDGLDRFGVEQKKGDPEWLLRWLHGADKTLAAVEAWATVSVLVPARAGTEEMEAVEVSSAQRSLGSPVAGAVFLRILGLGLVVRLNLLTSTESLWEAGE